MITCSLKVHSDVDELYKIFLSETFESDRAKCKITKAKSLTFDIEAKDPVSAKAILNSILKILETYNKTKALI